MLAIYGNGRQHGCLLHLIYTTVGSVAASYI